MGGDSRSTLLPGERWGLAGLGTISLILTLGFALQFPPITGLWPWPDTPLSYTLVAAILAAITAPIGWIALTGQRAAAAGGALVMLVMFGGMGALTLKLSLDGTHAVILHSVAFVLGYFVVLGVYLYARRLPVRDPRPMPRVLRVSFFAFATVLVLIGGALILQVPNVLPWTVRPESSVAFGLIFLGPAVYFIHGLAQPSWYNAAGQLLAFLAYDLVLVGPLLSQLGVVRPEHFAALLVYLVVIAYSSVLAVYYLAVNPSTRLWASAPNRVPPR